MTSPIPEPDSYMMAEHDLAIKSMKDDVLKEPERAAAMILAAWAEITRLREELNSYRPVHVLKRGESAALCPTCAVGARCISGLHGCVTCVRKELKGVRSERG